MEDLKNQIFALLKKCPEHVNANKHVTEIAYYPEDNRTYMLTLKSEEEYKIKVSIYNYPNVFSKTISLTEKEYMDIKWSIEEWQNVLEEKAFEDFTKFTENEPNSMDDLLND